MRVDEAEARQRFSELLDRAISGETVEVARHGEVVAVIGPVPPAGAALPLAETLELWRAEWGVESWSDDPADDPFADARDRTAGRAAPW